MRDPISFFKLNTMKPRNWLLLLLPLLFVAVASVAPFLPGSNADFSVGISRFAQTIGYIGLPFVPFGLIWLIIEMRNKKSQRLNRWTNGFYPSLFALIPVLVFLLFKVPMIIREAEPVSILMFTIIISVVCYFVYRIQKLKRKTEYKFNSAPLYIVVVPVFALVTSKFVLEKVADLTRETVIVETAPLIDAIEQYKTDHGEYPENLESLKGKYIREIPKPRTVMRTYQYEKRPNSFQLTFERLWHWNATEVVVYDPLGSKGRQVAYENYATHHTSNWSYYLAD